MKETFCEILHLVFHSTLKVTRCILLLWQLCKRTKILVKWDFNLYLKSEYVHTSLPLSTITTLIWQNFVSLFYNLIVYFTTKMSWSNCPLLRFSFLTQIIVCIYTLDLNQNQSKIISKLPKFDLYFSLLKNYQGMINYQEQRKNKLQVQNHFNTNSLSLTCTHTTWALEQLYKHCRAVLWEPSTLKLWNLGYPAYAFYQKTMIP